MDSFDVLSWELGRECLLRVPYHSHGNLKAVCKTWEAVVNHPQFYEDRKKLGTSEQFICSVEQRQYVDETHRNRTMWVVSVFDPLRGTKKTLPPLPHFPGSHNGIPNSCDCVCVNQRLVLLSRWDPTLPRNTVKTLKTVFIFDFASSKWSRGADMPFSRMDSGALSVSPEGHIYIAGGRDHNVVDILRSAAVYNVFEDEWKLLPDMSTGMDECYGAFLHGKFFVISETSDGESDSDEELGDLGGDGDGDGDTDTDSDGYEPRVISGDWGAEIYDPERGAWTTLDKMSYRFREFPRDSLAVSSSGRLFSFQKKQGVVEYDPDENFWRALGSLPKTLVMTSCCVAWRDKIFVHGYVKRYNVPVCYMYEPPTIRGAAGQQTETIGKWTSIERSENFYRNGHRIHCACTLEV